MENIFYVETCDNIFFGDIVKAEWVSSIELTPTREVDIQSNFSCDVEFHYPQTLKRFDDLIEDSKLKTIEDTDSINETNNGKNKRFKVLLLWMTSLVCPINQIHSLIFDSD